MLHSSAGSKSNDRAVPRSSIAVRIDDPTQVAEARYAADHLSRLLPFDDAARSNLAIVVSEAAQNILRHASRGEIFLRIVDQNGVGGIELLALDKGPGIRQMEQAMRDGYSTAGTAGTGLGAMNRLSSSLDIYSRPGLGTALLANLWLKSPAPPGRSSSLALGVVNRALMGEPVCGDSWCVKQEHGRAVFLVVDGLGHGTEAAQAAQAAITAFEGEWMRYPGRPGAILQKLHLALQGTRGAAAAVAEWNEKNETVCFAGVGNIAGEIVNENSIQRTVSHHGIVGYQVRRIQEFTYPCPAGSLLMLHSDGIATPGSLDAYPGLIAQNPALIAGVLYRDFNRVRDDATLLVARTGFRDAAGKGAAR